jgi:RNA polymerase sigma-70 factor, ECF subfamily
MPESTRIAENQATIPFDQLYNLYALPLQHYLFRFTRNHEDAADLSQEAFLRLHQNGVRPETAKAWLFRTGYHLFVDKWRKKKHYSYLPLEQIPEPVLDGEYSPERALLASETEREVDHALMKLKPRDRTVLKLLKQGDVSYQEIARRTGYSENLVKSIIFRARGRMRRMMKIEDSGLA